ncbi:MAG: hypothetical protein AAB430_00430 [Patescibacteria group bacterium]
MFKLAYGKRPVVEDSQKISASVCVRNFLFKNKGFIEFDLKTEEGVKNLIQQIECYVTFNLKQENFGKTEFTEPNSVKMTYTRSNLGKGFIFWFVCVVCGRKVRYLYIPPNSQVSACRKCHRLTYDQQNDNKRFRSLNRLFR